MNTVTLWSPPHRRLRAALADAGGRLVDSLQAGLRLVRAVRRPPADVSTLAELDDRMRRDLGLAERRDVATYGGVSPRSWAEWRR